MTTPHLTENQMAEWLAGERPAALALHVEQCAQCGAELGAFLNAVGVLRSGLREASAGAAIPRIQPAVPSWSTASRWVLAGAMTALLAAVPIYRMETRSVQPVPVVLVAAEMSDAVLFDQVNAQLSQGVPNAMEPLAALVWVPKDFQLKRKSE